MNKSLEKDVIECLKCNSHLFTYQISGWLRKFKNTDATSKEIAGVCRWSKRIKKHSNDRYRWSWCLK